MRLRCARSSDLEALVAFENRVFPDDPSRILRRQWAALLGRPGAVVVLAEGGRLLGVLVLERRGGTLRILSLGVEPEARRSGIARVLLDFAERRARREGRGALRLEVGAENHPARSLYAKAGFAVVAVLPDYYGPGRDGLRLERRLDGPGR